MSSSPLPDALEAALDLTGHTLLGGTSTGQEPREPSRPLWYYLAAVSADEAGLLDPEYVTKKAERAGDQATLSRARQAHEGARSLARSLTLSTE